MRKTQEKLIERARKNGFSETAIEILSNEKCNMEILNGFYNMLKDGCDAETIQSVVKYIEDNVESEYWQYEFKSILCREFPPELVKELCLIIKEAPEIFSSAYVKAVYLSMLGRKRINRLSAQNAVEYIRKICECSKDMAKKLCDSANLRTAISYGIPFEQFVHFLETNEEFWTNFLDLPAMELLFPQEMFPKVKLLSGEEWNSDNFKRTACEYVCKKQIETFAKSSAELANTGETVLKTVIENGAVDASLKVGKGGVLTAKLGKSTVVIKNGRVNVEKWNPKTKDDTIIIFPDGGSYYVCHSSSSDRYFPLTLKYLSRVYREYGEVGKNVVHFILNICEVKLNAPVFRDIARILDLNGGYLLLPIKTEECRDMHSLNELCRTKWKCETARQINWNKTDVNIAYMICKSVPYVNDKGKKVLLQRKKWPVRPGFLPNDTVAALSKVNSRNASEMFLSLCIEEKISVEGKEEDQDFTEPQDFKIKTDLDILCEDYVYMAKMIKEKISLSMTSEKKLREKHDALCERTHLFETVRVEHRKPPKKSRFEDLRKILPDEFEWIRNYRRIVDESSEMHNCVAGAYWDKVVRDECAIYSFFTNGKRYTVEFREDNGEYILKQIQLPCNAGCPKSVEKYVKDLLKNKR